MDNLEDSMLSSSSSYVVPFKISCEVGNNISSSSSLLDNVSDNFRNSSNFNNSMFDNYNDEYAAVIVPPTAVLKASSSVVTSIPNEIFLNKFFPSVIVKNTFGKQKSTATSSSPSIDLKGPKLPNAFVDRMQQNKKDLFSSRKCGLAGHLNKEIPFIRVVIDNIIETTSKLSHKGSLAFKNVLLKCFDDNLVIPVINQTFINQCMCVGNGKSKKIIVI